MRLKTGDNVRVLSGKDRGKSGKITQVFPALERVVIDGVNVMKRHLRPTRRGEKGQTVEFSGPIAAAKVAFLCPKCGKPTRLGITVVSEPTGKTKKMRVCKKCQETFA